MATLQTGALTDDLRSTGSWAAALLHALARDEAFGRRPPRVTEPKLETWARFRGRLISVDLLQLLFEDAAVIHPVPFDADAVGGPGRLDRLPVAVVDAWLQALQSSELKNQGAAYIIEQAQRLGVPSRLARADLHVVKPHQKVLELPGTGGQLAHHLVATQGDLTLQNNFTVACGSWQELTLAGVVGLDLGAPHTDFAFRADVADLRNAEHPLRQRSFDVVVGLHPDKGGLFRVEDQLAIWFPNAKKILV